jgi:hypothetical protein
MKKIMLAMAMVLMVAGVCNAQEPYSLNSYGANNKLHGGDTIPCTLLGVAPGPLLVNLFYSFDKINWTVIKKELLIEETAPLFDWTLPNVRKNKDIWIKIVYFGFGAKKAVRINNFGEVWAGVVLQPPETPYVVGHSDPLDLDYLTDTTLYPMLQDNWTYTLPDGTVKGFSWDGDVMLAPNPACDMIIKAKLKVIEEGTEKQLSDTQKIKIIGRHPDMNLDGSYSGSASGYKVTAQVSDYDVDAKVYSNPVQVCSGFVEIGKCNKRGDISLECRVPSNYIYVCNRSRYMEYNGRCVANSNSSFTCTLVPECGSSVTLTMSR